MMVLANPVYPAFSAALISVEFVAACISVLQFFTTRYLEDQVLVI